MPEARPLSFLKTVTYKWRPRASACENRRRNACAEIQQQHQTFFGFSNAHVIASVAPARRLTSAECGSKCMHFEKLCSLSYDYAALCCMAETWWWLKPDEHWVPNRSLIAILDWILYPSRGTCTQFLTHSARVLCKASPMPTIPARFFLRVTPPPPHLAVGTSWSLVLSSDRPLVSRYPFLELRPSALCYTNLDPIRI